MDFLQSSGTCPAPEPALVAPTFAVSATPQVSEQPSPVALAINLTPSSLDIRLQLASGNVTRSTEWAIPHELMLALPFIALAALLLTFAYFTLAVTYFSPFQRLQRPSIKGFWSYLMGNLIEMQKYEPGHIQMDWTNAYGGAVVYRGMLGTPRMLLSDPLALSYVLTNAYNFPKPAGARAALTTLLGEGVLTTEGHQHKVQRKLVNPTFSQNSVRAFAPLFHRHARALTLCLNHLIKAGDHSELAPAMGERRAKMAQRGVGPVVDILHWTSRTTLDVIGDAAFSYDLHSLNAGENGGGTAIAESFQTMMTRVGQLTLFERAMLHFEQFRIFDGWRPLPTSFNKAAQETQKTVEQVAGVMIDDEKRAQVVDDSDLLQKLLALNEDPKVAPANRLSRKEVLGQLTTLILAGHETTSTALTWALWTLAHHAETQTALRREIREHWVDGNEDFSFEEVHGLDLLDRVTSEVLRLHPPVHSTNRESSRKDVIPLSKPVRQRDGTFVNRIAIPRNQPLIISIVTYNRRKDIWGEDAEEFKPDRWLDLPDTVKNNGIPGGHLAFISGPRNCVGSKFALTEFKIIISHLLRRFEFAPLPPDLATISSKQVVVTRPRVKGLEESGTQMPLRISRVED